MKKTLFLLLFPVFGFSQDLLIKALSENINTNNAEINFFQINDTTAYFTSLSQKNNSLRSNIFSASFSNGVWKKNIETIYNYDSSNTSNIFFSEEGKGVFTICDDSMLNCRIVYVKNNKTKKNVEIPALSSTRFFNTQPTIHHINSQTVLYFVSDRNGGLGGLDIWLSIIDKNGNFGVPINAGKNINTQYDEITPFYNKHDGMLYFSSNKKGGIGGFDIYKSKGNLNLWNETINAEDLNSDKDDLYLIFYDEHNGYFASNRKGSKFENTEYCCNDIFSFEYKTNNQENTQKSINQYFPLNLYFHNDEPDPSTLEITTKKTYRDTYVSYFVLKEYYESKNPDIKGFFEDTLQKNFNTLNILLDTLIRSLSRNQEIEIQIRGFSSPLHNERYNLNLSHRRIASLKNYINQFRGGAFKEHILLNRLNITELPLGELYAPNNVSDARREQKKSIYSIEAMLERKVEIVRVILKRHHNH